MCDNSPLTKSIQMMKAIIEFPSYQKKRRNGVLGFIDCCIVLRCCKWSVRFIISVPLLHVSVVMTIGPLTESRPRSTSNTPFLRQQKLIVVVTYQITRAPYLPHIGHSMLIKPSFFSGCHHEKIQVEFSKLKEGCREKGRIFDALKKCLCFELGNPSTKFALRRLCMV